MHWVNATGLSEGHGVTPYTVWAHDGTWMSSGCGSGWTRVPSTLPAWVSWGPRGCITHVAL